MPFTTFDLLTIPWAILCLYWLIKARQTHQTTKAETSLSRTIHLSLLAIAFGLALLPQLSIGILGRRFIPLTSLSFFAGLALTIIGTGFAILARHELGQNWSGTVTIKADHHLIQSGPYRLSRHPIYTGMFFALIGTAVAIGEWRGLLAVVLMLAAYLRKIQIEEQWLSEEFPVDYPSYRHRVKTIVPFLF